MVKKSGSDGVGKLQKTLYQHNYIDVITNITPDVYADTDFALYGSEEDVLYSVLGKVLNVIDTIDGIFDVSATAASSLHQRFIPRNNLTNIRPYIFDQKILKPLGRSLADFTSKDQFTSFLSGVLLPEIVLNKPSSKFTKGVGYFIDETVTDASSTHQYLLDTLSWFYVLNSSSTVVGGVDPSSLLVSSLSKLWGGTTLTEKEGVSLIFEYLWTNRELSTPFYNYLPRHYSQSNSQVSSNFHTSGTQQWDNLETLLHVWYNPHDESSTVLDDYLDLFINNNTFTPKQIQAGALTKFLQAISFGFYDVNSTIEDLGNLVDIERCPAEFLPQLAALIGWKLMTGDVDRWRAQLRKAVYLYKGKGTRKSLEEALELVFSASAIIPTEEIHETWEMYLPRMIYYLIATASETLNSDRLSPDSFKGIPSKRFSNTNLDLNYRSATDYVLEVMHANTPPDHVRTEGGCIYINRKKFNLSSWDPGDIGFQGFTHRGLPDCPVPPWEDDRFYDNAYITKAQVEILNDILTSPASSTSTNSPKGGLGIPVSYVSTLSGILVHDDIDIWSSLSPSALYHQSWNHKWKFYSEKYSKPPNLSEVIAEGNPKKIGLFDHWQSKSSMLTARVYIQKFNTLSERLIEDGIPADPEKILENIQQVFKQFTPFHVLTKIFELILYTDEYSPIDVPICPYIKHDVFDLSPSGDFDHYILNNLTPSSISIEQLYSIATLSSTDTSANYSITTHPNAPRASGRRRNLKYLNTFKYFTRNGKAMPLHRNAVLGKDASAYDGLGVHTSEFIPLGYNFSSGKYFSTSGSFKGVYDASNDLSMSALPLHFRGGPGIPGTEVYLPAGRGSILNSTSTHEGVTVSSTFPCRAPFTHLCVSVPLRGDLKGIKRVIISSLVRQGKTDDFSDKTLNNFKFGDALMSDYYSTSGVLENSTLIGDKGNKYSENDIKIIYSHFNEMVANNATRAPVTGSSQEQMFQITGGSRGYYLDPYGTDDPGTYGLTTSGSISTLANTAKSGILFNLNDD